MGASSITNNFSHHLNAIACAESTRGRKPSSAYIDSVPPQMNELEYGFPRGSDLGYPSTVPPPLAAMKPSAPSNAFLRTPSRLWSRSTKKQVVLQSGGATSILLYPLIRAGSSGGGPN